MINLCTNALHAMAEAGGQMEINLTNRQLVETELNQYPDLNPGPHVVLSISDTGCGIDPEIRDRVFDPYFTTKDVDKGTGMGLAVVHGIVKNHEGAILIESEPGKGTTVHVLFPIVETVKEEIVPQPPAELPGGNERILFVDDESSITRMGQLMLQRLGYRCETKVSPTEALELFQSDPTRFDLVITDMAMPKMTGVRLAKEIIRIQPDIPIILSTGFGDEMAEEEAKALGIKAYIIKPMAMNELAKTIRSVLDLK
jgi:CheY-like chemotaxis protein